MIRQIYCQENNTCVAIPLQKRKVIKKSLRAIYPLLLLLILIVLTVKIDIIPVLKDADMSDVLTLSLQPLALLIFALFIPIYQILYFRYYFYDLTDKHVIIKKGVIARNEATISYDRIQNVFVDQDFWDRIFKLYDVHIATADYQSARIAHIDGVSKENSEKLKALLLENITKAGSNRSV